MMESKALVNPRRRMLASAFVAQHFAGSAESYCSETQR
jgi:hypothetical protein